MNELGTTCPANGLDRGLTLGPCAATTILKTWPRWRRNYDRSASEPPSALPVYISLHTN